MATQLQRQGALEAAAANYLAAGQGLDALTCLAQLEPTHSIGTARKIDISGTIGTTGSTGTAVGAADAVVASGTTGATEGGKGGGYHAASRSMAAVRQEAAAQLAVQLLRCKTPGWGPPTESDATFISDVGHHSAVSAALMWAAQGQWARAEQVAPFHLPLIPSAVMASPPTHTPTSLPPPLNPLPPITRRRTQL